MLKGNIMECQCAYCQSFDTTEANRKENPKGKSWIEYFCRYCGRHFTLYIDDGLKEINR